MTPSVTAPFASSRPMKDLVNTLLPEPLSPTMASTSPCWMSRSMPRMACRTRPRRLKQMWTFRAERMGVVCSILRPPLLHMVLGVGGVREGVADQVERDGDKAEDDGGVEQLVAQPGLHHDLAAVVDQVAQGGGLHRQ